MAIFLALLLPLTISIGCSTVVLHPIAKQDLVIMPAGQSYTPDRKGYFLSELYFNKVLKVKKEMVDAQ